MTFLSVLLGLSIGSLLNWLRDYVPRFVSGSAASSYECEPASRPRSALWHLLTSSIRVKRSSTRLPKSSWLDVLGELFTALLFAYLWARFELSWRLLSLTLTCTLFLLIAIIDLKYRLVPNILVYPAMAIALLFHSIPPGRDTLIALLGGVVGLSPFLLVALLKPGSMGGGDVKLAALIGLIVGFPQVLWALTVGILAGGITAFILLLTRRWGPKNYIPYAPFLCLGAISSLVYDPLSLVLSSLL